GRSLEQGLELGPLLADIHLRCRQALDMAGGKALRTRLGFDLGQLLHGGSLGRIGGKLGDRRPADIRQYPALDRHSLFAQHGGHQTYSSPPPDKLSWPLSASLRAAISTSFCAASTSLRRTGPLTSRSSRIMSAARLDMLAKILSRIAGSAPLSAVTRVGDGTSRSSNCKPLSSISRRSSKTNIRSSMCPPSTSSWVRIAAMISVSRLPSMALRMLAAALRPPIFADFMLLALPENWRCMTAPSSLKACGCTPSSVATRITTSLRMRSGR